MELLKVCAFAALAHDDEVAGPLDEGVGNLPGAQGEADVPDALAFEALLGSVENGTAKASGTSSAIGRESGAPSASS